MNNSEKIIVAADGDYTFVRHLMRKLKGTGCYIKFNSILRERGYGLITEAQDNGLKVFADLKLVDIPATLENDAENLRKYGPELLTVMAQSDVNGMKKLVEYLHPPRTEVLAVTVLTSLNGERSHKIFGCSPEEGVLKFAEIAKEAGVGGLILSPKELHLVKNFPGTLNTPGIRPSYLQVGNDDQQRTTTPLEAIQAGATRIVIGRPITQADNPLDALKRIIEEIS